VPRQVVLVDAKGEPSIADAAPHRDQFEILSVHVPVSPVVQSLGIESNVLGVSVSPLRDSIPATFALCGLKHRAFRSVAVLVETSTLNASCLLN
jgi:hypothetical protein